MATGLTVSDDDISVGGRTVAGTNLARVQVGLITHTSDTAITAQGSGGSQMGAAVSMVVPTAGAIRITIIEIEVDETNGAIGQVGVGLKIGSDSIVWSQNDDNAGTSYFQPRTYINSSATSMIINTGFSAQFQSNQSPTFDIVGNGMSTGTQDVEVWLGDNVNSATGEVTVTGTTVEARILVEIIDGS